MRVDLRGRSPLAAALRDPEERSSSAEELALALGALSAELRCEHLRPPLELDKHRGQPHLLGAALELAAARRRGVRCSTSSPRRCSRATTRATRTARRAYLAEPARRARRDPRRGAPGRGRRREDRPPARRRLRAARRPRARGARRERPRRRLRPERGRQVEPALVRGLDALRLLAGRARGSPGDAARRTCRTASSSSCSPDGARVRVERHLRTRPSGRAWRGEAQEELANRPLAEVAWLERGTYLALHAFDADELRGLDAATWREIEQRLLGGASPAFLRPAAIAAQELSTGADALWRSDRRGKPRSAELSPRLAELREVRREALAAGARARRGRGRARARARASSQARGAARRSSTGGATCTTATLPRCAPGRSSSGCAARPRRSCPRRSPRASARSPASGSRRCAARSPSAGASSPTCAARSRRRARRRSSASATRCCSSTPRRSARPRSARARDEGERDQLGIERARAREPGRAQRRPRRSACSATRCATADEAALETVQVADLQAAATRCERSMPGARARASRTSRLPPSVAAARALPSSSPRSPSRSPGGRASPLARRRGARRARALGLARARGGRAHDARRAGRAHRRLERPRRPRSATCASPSRASRTPTRRSSATSSSCAR